MNRVTFDRYLQRIKMVLSRDTGVIGVLYLGPVMDPPRSADVRDLDFLIVTRDDPATAWLDDLAWLPDSDAIVASVRFSPGHREVILGDGRLVRLSARQLDDMPTASIGAYRVLLDRGGINRLARALSDPKGAEVRPALPERPGPEHVLALAYSAWLYRRRSDEVRAGRLMERALEAAGTGAGTVADALEQAGLKSALPALVGWVAAEHPDAGPVLETVRQFVGTTEPPGTRGAPRPPAPFAWRPSADEVPFGFETPRVTPRDESAARDQTLEQALTPPEETDHPEPVLARDTCPFCGGALGPEGRLYVKGSLNDVRFLEGLSATLDFKDKVIARPCTACGQISLRLEAE